MANPEHLARLKEGAEAWNEWREKSGECADLGEADLHEADLSGADLYGANLRGADLRQAKLFNATLRDAHLHNAHLYKAILRGANLYHASLLRADLREANLRETDLSWATLHEADLREADLGRAKLIQADLSGADLSGADLRQADLFRAKLRETNFSNGVAFLTLWADVDLSEAVGLESITHQGASIVGIDTLAKSRGRIPDAFLRGCGVPEPIIAMQKSLVGDVSPIQFYSCFISYSHRDEEFCRRLHARMQQEGLRVWFAPEEMKGGRKIHDQIDEAIRVYDKLLVVLSEASMGSEWVVTEILKARKRERSDKRQVLFPIRLVDFETIRDWERFDADSGKDMACEIREYFIPDFSNWKNHDDFETAFARLLKDLKASA